MNFLNFLETATTTMSGTAPTGSDPITDIGTASGSSIINSVSETITTTTEAGGASASAGFWGILGSILPFALIILVFYFLMIRPQRKQQKEQEAMRNSIDVGDQITTIGGIVGVVRQIKDDGDIYVIETGANNDRMTIRKWAVQSKDTISE